MNNVFFTATQLQGKIGTVLDAVQDCGTVEIINRSRPNMVLMTQKHLDELLKNQFENSDYVTHHTDWVAACEIAKLHSDPSDVDFDDKGYWQKQIDTLAKLKG